MGYMDWSMLSIAEILKMSIKAILNRFWYVLCAYLFGLLQQEEEYVVPKLEEDIYENELLLNEEEGKSVSNVSGWNLFFHNNC